MGTSRPNGWKTVTVQKPEVKETKPLQNEIKFMLCGFEKRLRSKKPPDLSVMDLH